MKSKILLVLSFLVVFAVGSYGGFYFGVSGSAGSMSSQLYASASEIQIAITLMDKSESEQAREVLCRSLKTRLDILDLASPVLGDRQLSEVNQLKISVLEDRSKDLQEEAQSLCL